MLKKLAATLCAAVLIMAAWSVYVEAQPYFAGVPSDLNRLERARDGGLSPGFSLATTKFVLDECAWAMTSPYGTLQAKPMRLAIATSCGQKAADIAAARPTDSYAWLIRGVSAEVLGDADLLNTSLVLSERMAPTSQWLANSRVTLSAAWAKPLTPDAHAAEDGDLAILVRSKQGIAAIARRYVNDPDFRERITNIVETLPEVDQQRFVHNVKDAVKVVLGQST